MSRRVIVALVSALVLGHVCPAAAQNSGGLTSPRPWRGLFGGSTPQSSRMEETASQRLDFSGSLTAGWDDDLSGLVIPPELVDRYRLDGKFGAVSGTLNYTKPGERFSAAAFVSTAHAYYPDAVTDHWYDSQAAGLNASLAFEVTRKTRARFIGSGYYSTDLRFGGIGGGIGGVPGSDIPSAGGSSLFDYGLGRDPSASYEGRAEIDHRFSSRSTLSAFYGQRYRQFFDNESFRQDSWDSEIGARFTRGITRHASLVLGYRYREFEFDRADDPAAPLREPTSYHDVDVGVNYGRSLSLSRNTQFSFGTGTTLAASDRPEDDQFFEETRVFLVGNAALTHQIGRSWTARADYSRRVDYYEGYDGLALSDVASVGVGGLVTRGLDFSAGLSYTSGDFGLTGSRNYSNWVASSQLRAALTRTLAAYASYYYYMADLPQGLLLPDQALSRFERQGVRVGLTAWLPVWSARRGN